ncbi:DUF2933 domain-containing protein [Nocardioides zhouii]|uniref:DUF2933 domain-containing protein n=1 Tax=Nocardioides zhouii TaxID=1168729 RepID=A0A4Q2SIN3_9ACTN|nr:DUF2933 domain-containing protein [Nocardioides zhouii]RYC03809.1 DUF2933 domain-containing protein [Nocardioides zhouii]
MSDNKVLYAIAIIAGAGIAIWAGLLPIFLLFIACPIAMMFMMGGMSGMGGMHGSNDAQVVFQRQGAGRSDDSPRRVPPRITRPYRSPLTQSPFVGAASASEQTSEDDC